MFLQSLSEKSKLEHIDYLISNRVPEGQMLDYKEKLPDIDKLLKTITAMTNAKGGCIVIGIKEDKGFPIKKIGIKVPNQEQLTQNIDEKMKKFTDPPLRGVKYQFIEIEPELFIVLIHVPKSSEPFQACCYNNNWINYFRENARNDQLTVNELNKRATQENPKKEYKSYIESRINLISQGKCPVAHSELEQKPFFLFHANPISNSNIDFSEELKKELTTYVSKFLAGTNIELQPSYQGCYVKSKNGHHLLLHKSGYIEYGKSAGSRTQDHLPYKIFQGNIEKKFLPFFIDILSIINKYHSLTPLLISYSLCNVHGAELSLDDEIIASPAILKEERYVAIIGDPLNYSPQESLSKLKKELFDPIWNAVGQEKSPFS